MGELRQKSQQIPIVVDGKAGLLGQGLVEQAPRQIHLGCGQTGSQTDGRDAGAADRIARPDGGDRAFHIADAVHAAAALPDGGVQSALDGMVVGQRVHPGGQKQIQLLDRELIEHTLDDVGDRPLIQLQTIGAHTGDVIP